MERQDTEVSPPLGSTLLGVAQLVPLYVVAFPFQSTAAQKVLDVQDTEVKPPRLASVPAGADQVPLR
jgi:hypothetical protein